MRKTSPSRPAWKRLIPWPRWTSRRKITVSVTVRETPPRPDHTAGVVFEEWEGGARQGHVYWKAHIENILKLEAFLIGRGYRNLREFIFEQSRELSAYRRIYGVLPKSKV